MNYYTTNQIAGPDGQPSGLWHFTRRNDGDIRPVGYCAAGCPGHGTEAGAREHYRQYLIDNATYDGVNHVNQHRCKVCDAWTQRYATSVYDIYYLCEEHCNPDGLAKVMGRVGDIVSSY